jgi:hypothetical protein
MADNIFQDIGKAIGSPIGNLVQGAYRGLAPGVYEQEGIRRKQQELLRKLQILQQMPQGSPAQMKYARSIMETHGPEIMKNLPQGAYQPQATFGAEPGAYKYLTPEERKEAARTYGGLRPRAGGVVDELIKAQKLSELTTSQLDPTQAEPGKERLKSAADKTVENLTNKLLGPQRPSAVTPTTPPRMPLPLGRGTVPPRTAPSWTTSMSAAASSWLTGQGTAPGATTGKDKDYGIPMVNKGVGIFKDVKSVYGAAKGAYGAMTRGKPSYSRFDPDTKASPDQRFQMPSPPTEQVERKVWDKYTNAWFSMPGDLQWTVWSALNNGWTWSEIEQTGSLDAYLK